jgi:hypothetical protein
MDAYVVSHGESTWFQFYTDEDTVEFEFTFPEEMDLRVYVEGEYGDELGDFKLSEGEVISLYGGGEFTLWVYSRDGEGDFICEPSGVGEHYPLLAAGGRLEELSVDFFSLYSEADSVELTFTVPEPDDYSVTVYGEYGDELGEFNLGDGEVISLTGGGEFSLAIVCDEGEGDWEVIVDYME